MSDYAPDWYTHEFSTMVNHYYQTAGWEMKGLFTPPAKIDGEKIYWPYMGEFVAQEAIRNQASEPISPLQELIEHAWSHYEVQGQRFVIDLDKTTIEANAAWQKGMAMSLGRKHTNAAVAAMVTAAKGASQNTGAYNAAWSLDAASNAVSTLFDRAENDQETAICVLPFVAFQQMMAEPEFSSADFVGPELPFVQSGMKKTWNGCHWYGMPRRTGKNDPVFPLANSTELDFPMWLPSAVGDGSGFEGIRTYVTWDNKIKAGAWDHKCVAGWGIKVFQVAGVQNCKWKGDSTISYA